MTARYLKIDLSGAFSRISNWAIVGAGLKERVRSIMAGRAGYRAGLVGKKLLLAGLAVAAVAVPLAIGLARPPKMRAQTAAPLRFDVVSVKVNPEPILWTRPERSGGRIRWTTDLHYLIGYAYHIQPWQWTGPVPGSDHIFDVNATTDPNATDDQVRLMFQSLLIDRFKMAVHREEKEVDGYALTVAKGGEKMQVAKEGEIPPLPAWASLHSEDPARMEGLVLAVLDEPGIGHLTGRRVTMLQFTETLQRLLETAVVEQTGLTAKYYFELDYATGNFTTEVPVPDLFSAVKELGLKLEKHKGPAEILVVDHIEKTPTEN